MTQIFKHFDTPSNLEKYEESKAELAKSQIYSITNFMIPKYKQFRLNENKMNKYLEKIYSDEPDVIYDGLLIFSSIIQSYSIDLPDDIVCRLISLTEPDDVPDEMIPLYEDIKTCSFSCLAYLFGNLNSKIISELESHNVLQYFLSNPNDDCSLIAFSLYSLKSPSNRDTIIASGVIDTICNLLQSIQICKLELLFVCFFGNCLTVFPFTSEEYYSSAFDLFLCLSQIQRHMEIDAELFFIRACGQFSINDQFVQYVLSDASTILDNILNNYDPYNFDYYKAVLSFIFNLLKKNQSIDILVQKGVWGYLYKCLKSPFDTIKSITLEVIYFLLDESFDPFFELGFFNDLPNFYDLSYNIKEKLLKIMAKILVISRSTEETLEISQSPGFIPFFFENLPDYPSSSFLICIKALHHLLNFYFTSNDLTSFQTYFNSSFQEWNENVIAQLEESEGDDEIKDYFNSFEQSYQAFLNEFQSSNS